MNGPETDLDKLSESELEKLTNPDLQGLAPALEPARAPLETSPAPAPLTRQEAMARKQERLETGSEPLPIRRSFADRAEDSIKPLLVNSAHVAHRPSNRKKRG